MVVKFSKIYTGPSCVSECIEMGGTVYTTKKQSKTLSRRNFLKKSGVLGGVYLSATKPAEGPLMPPWTVVVLPDTQKYAESATRISYAQDQADWIVANRRSQNIVFVTHEGDIVENGDDIVQWRRMDAVMDTLDGVVPYSTLLGNRDYAIEGDRDSSTANYRRFFGESRYRGYDWFGGAAPGDRGYYQRFSAGNYEFVHLGLEWGVPGDLTDPTTVLGWARDVLDANPNTPTIVTTHSYLWDRSGREGHSEASRGAHSGQWIYQHLVKPNPQVFMVLCGHSKNTDGEWTQVSKNDARSDVFEMLANYQHYAHGGKGLLRIIRFVPGGGTTSTAPDRIEVQTYSPSLSRLHNRARNWVDNRNQFTFELKFSDRFGD